MLPKSLISQLSRAIASVSCQTSRSVTALFISVLTSWQTKYHIPMNVLTFSGILLYNFEPLTKKGLAAASAYVHLEQPPVPLTPNKSWIGVYLFVLISLINKSTHSAWRQIFPSSYHKTSFKIKWYLSVHRSPVDAWLCGLYRNVPPSVEHLLD